MTRGLCNLSQTLGVGVALRWLPSHFCWGTAMELGPDGQNGGQREWAVRSPLRAFPLIRDCSKSQLTPCHDHAVPGHVPPQPQVSSSRSPLYGCTQNQPQVGSSLQFQWVDLSQQTGRDSHWLREKVAEKSPIIYPHWSNMEVGTGNSSRKTLHMERGLESSHLQTGLTCLLPSKIEMTISGYMCKERRRHSPFKI